MQCTRTVYSALNTSILYILHYSVYKNKTHGIFHITLYSTVLPRLEFHDAL